MLSLGIDGAWIRGMLPMNAGERAIGSRIRDTGSIARKTRLYPHYKPFIRRFSRRLRGLRGQLRPRMAQPRGIPSNVQMRAAQRQYLDNVRIGVWRRHTRHVIEESAARRLVLNNAPDYGVEAWRAIVVEVVHEIFRPVAIVKRRGRVGQIGVLIEPVLLQRQH